MRCLPTVLLALLLLCGSADAQGLQAVRPVPGHVCMQLAITPEQNADPTRGIPVRNSPSLSDRIASWAPSVVIVPAPQQPTAGFLRVLLPDGQHGWVQAIALKPWSNPYAPNRRCVPSVLSNGRIGFDVH